MRRAEQSASSRNDKTPSRTRTDLTAMDKPQTFIVPARHIYVLVFVLTVFSLMMVRAGYLQLVQSDELQKHGDARYLRNEIIKPNRGLIEDRNGMILAASTSSDTVWLEPHVLTQQSPQDWQRLAATVGVSYADMAANITQYSDNNRHFMYLRRHISPALAQEVRSLDIPGVNLMTEYRRYYPFGEMLSSLVGYTNIDDIGLEGIELMHNERLQGRSGLRQVIKDKNGRTVETVDHIRRVVDGEDVALTIDARIQHLVYKSLDQAFREHQADTATAVVIDVQTGEILALAGVPSFNPNVSKKRNVVRNFAVTDVIEPGSSAKPFVVAKALHTGLVRPTTVIDTSPGVIRVDGFKISDFRNYGELTVSDVIMKSSNIGVVEIGQLMQPDQLIDFYQQFGFGSLTGSGLLGESAGLFPRRTRWRPSERATLTFGYGFSVTALQLVQAYAAIANRGILTPLSIIANQHPQKTPSIVLPVEVASEVTAMLERAVSPQGTSRNAKFPYYRVGGKTATVQKLVDGVYSDNQHISMFVGFAPVSNPRLATVVVVDHPKAGKYYGGHVAAPVFRQIMRSAMTILNITPDDIDQFAAAETKKAAAALL